MEMHRAANTMLRKAASSKVSVERGRAHSSAMSEPGRGAEPARPYASMECLTKGVVHLKCGIRSLLRNLTLSQHNTVYFQEKDNHSVETYVIIQKRCHTIFHF